MAKRERLTRMRAEHDSLPEYLHSRLTPEQLARPLIVTFSQWEMNTSVVAEIAANFHDMRVQPTVALWADKTPMRDVGWTTSHLVSRLFLSPARDQRVIKALHRYGLPREAVANPPLRKWRPQGEIPEIRGLNRSAIRSLMYRGAPAGRAILQVHPDDQTPVTDDHLWPREWVVKSLESFAFAYDQVLELIKQRQSTALIVFNGRFLHDAAAVSAAESCGLPGLSFDFGGNDTDYDLTADATHDWSALQDRMKDLYAGWNVSERDEIGSRWFEDRRRHTDERNAAFVESQVVGRGVDLPSDRTIVVFFSSSGDEISELDVDWGDYFYGQPGALKAVAEICRRNENFHLVVRTHPHKRMKPRRDVEEWHQAVEAAAPDVHLDEWSDVDSYTLMDQADLVVTFGSTTGVEAAFAKKPVIVMGPSAYDELGCASRVRNREEIEIALERRQAGDWAGAVAYGLMMNRRGFRFSHVRQEQHARQLSGVTLSDSNSVVLRASHFLGERARRSLAQDFSTSSKA